MDATTTTSGNNTDLLEQMAEALEQTAEYIDVMPPKILGTLMMRQPNHAPPPPPAAASSILRFQAAAMKRLASDRRAGRLFRTRAERHSTDG